MGSIDIGDKMHLQFSMCKGTERFGNHAGTKIRPADTDIDDISHRLPGISLPLAGYDSLTAALHLPQDIGDFR